MRLPAPSTSKGRPLPQTWSSRRSPPPWPRSSQGSAPGFRIPARGSAHSRGAGTCAARPPLKTSGSVIPQSRPVLKSGPPHSRPNSPSPGWKAQQAQPPRVSCRYLPLLREPDHFSETSSGTLDAVPLRAAHLGKSSNKESWSGVWCLVWWWVPAGWTRYKWSLLQDCLLLTPGPHRPLTTPQALVQTLLPLPLPEGEQQDEEDPENKLRWCLHQRQTGTPTRPVGTNCGLQKEHVAKAEAELSRSISAVTDLTLLRREHTWDKHIGKILK